MMEKILELEADGYKAQIIEDFGQVETPDGPRPINIIWFLNKGALIKTKREPLFNSKGEEVSYFEKKNETWGVRDWNYINQKFEFIFSATGRDDKIGHVSLDYYKWKHQKEDRYDQRIRFIYSYAFIDLKCYQVFFPYDFIPSGGWYYSSAERFIYQKLYSLFDFEHATQNPELFAEMVTKTSQGSYWRKLDPRIALTRKQIPGVNCFQATFHHNKQVYKNLNKSSMNQNIEFMIRSINTAREDQGKEYDILGNIGW